MTGNGQIVVVTGEHFRVELFATQKGRFWAKAVHLATEYSYISNSFCTIEEAVDSALRGCVDQIRIYLLRDL
ncbi:MAG: hypothetical protein D6808_05335 [Candidatus Dadabacteria bacterium]|nr:MAG: hypothetical protein D6808_05335 [Candidatus Dadabacteria bacterium]